MRILLHAVCPGAASKDRLSNNASTRSGEHLISGRAFWLGAAVYAVLVIAPVKTFGADRTWIGASDTTWSNNSNWIGNHPGAGDNAVFNSTFSNQPNLTGNTTSGGLWMTGSVGQNVTISSSGGTLILNGNTINGTAGLGILVDNANAFALTINAPLKLGNAQTWTNSSSNLLTIGGPVDLNKKDLTVNGVGNTTVSGLVSNSGAFTKAGSGTLTLSNTANSFKGQLTVEAGTLKVDTVNDLSTDGELGNNALSVILGNTGGVTGTLEYSGGTASSTKTFTMATGGTGNFKVDSSGATLTLSGVIDGSGALSKNGAGTLALTALNTYSGGTTVNAGTIAINSASNLGASSGALTINAGTVELLAGNSISASRLFYLGNAASTFQVDSGSTWTIATVISNAGTNGSLNKTGAGTLVLSSPTGNTYGGSGYTTSINGGTLQVGADNVLGNSANTVTFNGGTLLFSSGFTSSRGVVMTGAGTINTSNNAATLSGIVSGSGVLTKTGAGTLTLSGTNTYSGGTILNAGALSITSDGNLGTGNLQLNNGATLITNGNFNFTHGFVLGAPGGPVQADGLAVSGIINVQSGTLTETTNGIIDNGLGGRLMKIGAGTLDLQVGGAVVGGNTAFSGGFYLHEGTLEISVVLAGGSNPKATIDNGATLLVNSSSGGVNALGQIEIGTGGALAGETSGNTSFGNGVISNVSGQSGGITFIGPGKSGLGGNNTFVGPVVIGNPATPLVPVTLSISRDVNLGAAANQLTIGNGSTLMIEDGIDATQPVGSAAFAATFSTSRQINLTGSTAIIDVENTGDAVNFNPAFNPGGLNTLAAHVNVLTINGLITGSGALIKNGPGTLVLTNTGDNYTGGTTINSGILSTSDSAQLGVSSSSLTINPTGIYQVTSSLASSRLVTLGGTGGAASGGTFDVTSTNNETRSGVISGTGSLTKTGSGTLILDAINTYTGDTFINGGTVSETSNQSLGPQPTLGSSAYAVHLANGTTLQEFVSSTGTNRQIELVSGTATLDIGSGFTQQRDGLIYGAGGLTKNGVGTLILTNANTYSGGTIINSGHLQVNNTSGSGTGTGAVTVNSGGTLSGEPTATGFTTPGTISGAVTVNSGGQIDVRSGGTFSFGGLALNAGAITNFQLGTLTTTPVINITGTNTLSLAGLSTINIANFAGGIAAGIYHLIDYTGTALTDLSNLQLGSTAGGAFTYSLSNNTANTSIDLLVSTSSMQWANDANGNWSSTGNWTNGIAPDSIGAAANFLNIINAPRTVTVNGAFTVGDLTFDNANSYTIAGDGVTGHGITVDGTGTADVIILNGSHTIAAPIALTDSLEILASSGTALTLSGPISENSAGRGLLSSGDGTVTLSGTAANTYTGLTEIVAGTLNLNKTAGVDAIGSGGLQIDVGATVTLLASNQIADTATVLANGTFALGTFAETIGALNGGGSVTVGAGSTLTIGASNNLDSDFDGVISGSGTITKAGNGTAEFDGANTFGGAGQTVTLLNGNLLVFADGNFGNAANTITFNGGTELFATGFSSARGVILTGSGTFNTNNNDSTLSGTISGAGALTKTGAGILTLSGTNTYSGGSILNGGALSITSESNAGTGSIQFNNGATLVTNGTFDFTHGFVLGAPGGPVQADGLAVSGIIDVQSGTLTETTNGITDGGAGGRLMKIGAGTLDLQVANAMFGGNTAYSGGTYVHEGTLVIGAIGALGTSPITTIDNGAALVGNVTAGGLVSAGQIKIGTGGAILGETSGHTIFGNGVISSVSGQSGDLTIVGPGKAGQGGNNTFVGTVLIGDPATPLVPAILSISRDVNLGAAANQLTIGNGSTLMIEDGIDATQPVGSAAIAATFSTSRQINLTGSTAIIDVENTGDAVNYNPIFSPGLNTLAAHVNVLTVDGLITGTGELIKAGPGTLVLTNTGDSYTGGTTINSGILSTSDSAQLGVSSSSLTINPTGIYQVTSSLASSRLVTLGGTGGASSGGTFDVTTGVNEERIGVIGGAGSLTKTGSGTLVLDAVNTYSGETFINSGTLVDNNSSSLGTGAATIGDATLKVINDITSTRNYTLSDANSTMQIDSGATYSVSGTIDGTGVLNKNGGGVLALTGTNTYTGGTSINAGTVIVNSTASLGNGGSVTLNAATLEVATGYSTSRDIILGNAVSTIQVDPAQTYTLNGVATGGGSLNKNGTGVLILASANTFTGDTVVNQGTLTAAAGSGSALATTATVTVNSGGTLLLGANDQINNAAPITLNGGTFAKGDFSEGSASAVGLGALTLTGPGSIIDFGTGAVGVLSFASLVLNVDTLAINNWTGTANTVGSGSTDRLIFDSDQSSNLPSFAFSGYAGATQFALGGSFFEVVPIDPVPEPATWFVAALTLFAVGYHHRKRIRADRLPTDHYGKAVAILSTNETIGQKARMTMIANSSASATKCRSMLPWRRRA